MARILCLHGYMQDAASFRNRLGHLRKTNPFKRGCEFVFLDAPYLVIRDDQDETRHRQVPPSDDVTSAVGRSWWQFSSSSTSTSARPSQAFKYSGIDASIAVIENAIRENDIDTILGFSQGAAMAAYFTATRDVRSLGIKRLLTYAGFLPKDPEVAGRMLGRAPVDSISSMFVAGTADDIITMDRTREAAAVFEGSRVYEHRGGHFVPTTRGELKELLAEFLV